MQYHLRLAISANRFLPSSHNLAIRTKLLQLQLSKLPNKIMIHIVQVT
jgi:hypothetical protein